MGVNIDRVSKRGEREAMTPVTSFNPVKTDLEEMLISIDKGKVQLPDFQRSWIWDDERIISLLESVSRYFPIGAILLLKSDGPRFICRLFEGVKSKDIAPEKILLDGQQRLTSLYRTLISKEPVDTRDEKKKQIRRFYYADLKKISEQADDGHFDDCFVSVNEHHKKIGQGKEVEIDLSTRELEYQNAMFPMNLIFDSDGYDGWKDGFCEKRPDGKDLINKARDTAFRNIKKYYLPVIELDAGTSNEAVCTIFEKVNTGGVPLTVFELLVATYAGGGFRLVEDWDKQKKRMAEAGDKLLKDLDRESFLTAVLVVSQIKGHKKPICKRGEILSMAKGEYLDNREAVVDGFIKAAKLLHREGIITTADIPYPTQLTVLAAVYSLLDESKLNLDPVTKKLSRWLWCGIFGEQWSSAVESKTARDIPQLLNWIDGGEEPEAVKSALFTEQRMLQLKSRNSAAYKGMASLIYRAGARDFRSGDPITTQMVFDNRIDIHHIFPKAACKKLGIDAMRQECIINKTPIDAATNRSIGGSLPSQYLKNLETNSKYKIPRETLDQILESHSIDVAAIHVDDFNTFYEKRKEGFIAVIEKLMEQTVVRMKPGDEQEVTGEDDEVTEEG